MNILLCAATDFEIRASVDFIRSSKDEKTEILITGVGAMQTAYHLTKRIHEGKPDLIIQAGIAGCFERTPDVDVYAIERDAPADLGVTENGKFLSVFQMKLADANTFPFSKGWLVNKHDVLRNCGLKTASAITVNEVTTDEERIAHYRSSGALVESMEGAALHYVALLENIPFLQLRAVSNYIGERDKSKWKIDAAINALNEKLTGILKQLNP